ncbi:MAG: amino acid ABC transporter substrate-binding protein [Lentisphaerae bacterium]|nr:amino acid ABC transporter substrate-binding protein [Lentisphaerota bacterium]
MKHILKLSALFFLPLLFSGCVAPELYLSGNTGKDAVIKVAAILPMSGSNRIFAEQMAEGLQMAAQDLNRNSVTGRKNVQLKIFDSKGTADGTAAAAAEAARWKAAGLVAGYSTQEVSRIIPYAVKFRMPVVIPLATSAAHSAASPFVYRNSYTDFQQANMLAGFLMYWRQVKNIGIFIGGKGEDEYQAAVGREVAVCFRDIGGAVTMTSPVVDRPDKNEIVEMLKSDPEAIMLTFGGKAAAQTIRELRNAGFTGIIFGADNWDDEELISGLDDFIVGDCLYTAFFCDDESVREYREFKTAFRKRFYHNPGACETQSYDALKFLVFGLRGASHLPDFDRNWRKIRQYQGVSARYTMLPKGEVDRTIYINSIGVRRSGNKLKPYARLSRKMQYSKLREYRPEFYQ